MIKLVIVLYIICFPIYILFSRQPDYFDGEKTIAIIHFRNDSGAHALQPFAFYSVNKETYSINAAYLFRSYNESQIVTVIYEASQPAKGAVYSVWGYWLRWGEIIFSIIFLVVMFRIAVTITSNPTPEALIEQLEEKPSRKRKYYN
jgi:hypothetical protein